MAERDVEEDDRLVEVGLVVKASKHDGEPSQTAKSSILGAFHILLFVLVFRVVPQPKRQPASTVVDATTELAISKKRRSLLGAADGQKAKKMR
jgi:hypothetical protein